MTSEGARGPFQKALWVVRDRIISKPAVDDLLADSVGWNVRDLVVQVRGRGDAYYESALEPRAEALADGFDPLAHLNVTTTAMGEAARLVDSLAHRWAGGRWLATGGGGYEIYRVVPRAWALVWLAGAHAEVPTVLPTAWRAEWAGEADGAWGVELPETFEDPPNAGLPYGQEQEAADRRAPGIAAKALATVRAAARA